MKKKHKKQLLKILLSLIAMLVVSVVGYFQGGLEESDNQQVLAKPERNSSSSIF